MMEKILAIITVVTLIVSDFITPSEKWETLLMVLFASGVIGFAWNKSWGERWLWKIVFVFSLLVHVIFFLSLITIGLNGMLEIAKKSPAWFTIDWVTMAAISIFLFQYAFRSPQLWVKK
jgi:hypothetical protein